MTLEAQVGVIGMGAMGSATLWQLASRGVAAVGFERFEPGNDRGSSHGDTRIIRTAYFEGPMYVPLVRRAWELWRALEAQTGAELLTATGALMIGRPESGLIRGTLASVAAHGLEHRVLDARDMAREYPQHVIDGDEVAIFEADAGYLRPEAAVRAAAGRAESLGARIMTGVEVNAIVAGEGSVTVRTAAGDHRFGRVVLAAGAWLPRLMPAYATVLHAERNVMGWFAVEDRDAFTPARFPIFIRELRDGRAVYGFPSTDAGSIKVAVHHGGAPADPDALDRTAHPGDVAPLREFVLTRLRGATARLVDARVCMYTNAPDGDFVIGPHPGSPRVIVLSPCSGHGFKFASVIGEVAADLAVDGRTRHDIAAFRPERLLPA